MTPGLTNPPTRTCLLLAAIANELDATIRRLGLKPDRGHHSGRVGSTRIVAAVTGTGTDRAKTATAQLVDTHKPDVVVLIGFAGGLDPGLPAGTVLTITWIVGEHGGSIHLEHKDDNNEHQPVARASVRLSDDQPRRTAEHSLVTVDQLAGTKAAKRNLLAQYRCAAVDMETFHAAHVLADRGVPLVIFRAISDPADMALPACAIDWVTPDGRTDVPAVLRHLLVHPWRTVTLIRLAQHAKLAAEQLADHVEAWIRRRDKS